jgi:uncharacterized membrane protein YtjA (UPF0391 family)
MGAVFFLVSIVAGIFGFTGVSAASADVARFLFYVFVVIFLVLLILGLRFSGCSGQSHIPSLRANRLAMTLIGPGPAPQATSSIFTLSG